jgi:protein CpxP
MIKLIDRHVAKLVTAALVGGLSLALSACAPGHAVDGSSASTVEGQAAQGHVETHIQKLHDKLQITQAQEPQFEAVANVIRSNEAAIHKLAEARHATENATAVQDLKSYQEIADAHSAGIAKLIPAFEDLYSTMSDEQKANADKVFSKYEGHEGKKEHRAHKAHKKEAAPKAAQ